MNKDLSSTGFTGIVVHWFTIILKLQQIAIAHNLWEFVRSIFYMPFSNEVDVMSNFKHQINQGCRKVWKSERASSNLVGIIYPLILIGLNDLPKPVVRGNCPPCPIGFRQFCVSSGSHKIFMLKEFWGSNWFWF
jgi:hypothetical protein